MDGNDPKRPRRGADENPPNRFERLAVVPDPDTCDPDPEGEAPPDSRTEFLRDASRSVMARNESPDISFGASINPYRGCEHGCAYCYARPTHEYLGFSAGLDFETRILVKEDAPALLRRELCAKSWVPQVVALSGVTDCYQPVERRLRITRGCLEVLAELRNPVMIVTKSALVARDADILAELARFDAAAVAISVTTLDTELQRALEPRAPRPVSRLRAVEKLVRAGVPVGVMVAPVIPGLTDHELPRILEAAAAAGAGFAGYVVLRLPYGVADLFEAWLDRHAPLRKQKILARIHALRGGRRNDPRFGTRLRGAGIFAEEISHLFALGCKRAGISSRGPTLSAAHFRRPGGAQLALL